MTLFIHRAKNLKIVVPFLSKLNNKLKFPNKLKGGRIESFKNYWAILFSDYKQVASDVYSDCKTYPKKSFSYISFLSFLIYLYKTNPDDDSFKNEIIEYQNIMNLVAEPIRNEKCYSYLYELLDLNQGYLLEKINFLFFTIYFRKEHNSKLALYQANCKYLKPSFYEYLTQNIVDIGIANKWIFINKKLVDFDINPVEWNNLKNIETKN